VDAGAIIAIVAAVIALIAMGLTFWQASEARKSRRATERQAEAAEKALVHTQTQADAAKESATSAMLSVDAAEKAANAAEVQAGEARKANALTREQIAAGDARQKAAALAHARKVTMVMTRMGAEAVSIRNGADEAFHELTLEDVVCTTHPSWGWQLNPRRRGARLQYDTLPGRDKRAFGIEFLDENGQPQPFELFGDDLDYSATITYRDATWQLWRRTNDAAPEPIEG
jgi:hypothetical protein